MTDCASLSYTSPYLTSYSEPLLTSPLQLSSPLRQDETKLPNLYDLNKIGLYQLEKLVYTYQIEYTTPISENQRAHLIKQFTDFLDRLDSINFTEIRRERMIQRSCCKNKSTFVAQNDVMLMADNQLFFLKDNSNFYALDRFRDLDRFWDNQRNLFTGEPLTTDQLLSLGRALNDTRYPMIEVDDLQQEVEKLSQKRSPQYLNQLINLASEYQLPSTHIQAFACDLNTQQYNDFLKHYSLRQKLNPHDQGALPYIIHKINALKGVPKTTFIKEIIWAIDDYMYMVLNNCSYEDLKTIRTPHYRPYDSQITKIIEGFDTYHIDLNGQKIGVYERKNADGLVIEKGTFKDDLKHGLFEYRSTDRYQTGYYHKNKKVGRWLLYQNGILIRSGYYRDNVPHGNWTFYDMKGTLVKEGSYLKGKKEGLWKHGVTQRAYYLDGVLLNYIL